MLSFEDVSLQSPCTMKVLHDVLLGPIRTNLTAQNMKCNTSRCIKNNNKININKQSSGWTENSVGLYEIALEKKKITLIIYNLTWHLNKFQLNINTLRYP